MIGSTKWMTAAAVAALLMGGLQVRAQDAPIMVTTDVVEEVQSEQPADAPADAPGAGRGGRRGFDPAQFFKRMDENGDGKIQKSEWRGPEEFFTTIDADKDGVASEAEFTKMREMRRGGPGGPGGGPGMRGGWGGRGPRVDVDDLKEQLSVNDEEWTVLKPALEKLTQRPDPGADTPMQDLRTLLENKDASAEDIKAKVDAVRAHRKKMDDQRKADREKARELLTPRQEAILISQGLLD